MKTRYLLGIIVVLLLINTLPAQNGREFWFAFMENDECNEPSQTYSCELYVNISSIAGATGTISIPLIAWQDSFNLQAGESVIIEIPYNFGSPYYHPSSNVHPAGILVTADNCIKVDALNTIQATKTNDAASIRPLSYLGNDFYITTYDDNSQYVVLAIEDSTVITIDECDDPSNTSPVDTTIVLNAGEVYQRLVPYTSLHAYVDLTGTHIQSQGEKQILVFSGARITFVPTSIIFADHIYEQMIPVSKWKKEYVTVPFMEGNTEEYFRILSITDSTLIDISGSPALQLDSGQWTEFSADTALYITANNAISVTQFNAGVPYTATSDPFMVLVRSTSEMITSSIFYAYNTSQPPFYFDSQHVSLITKTSNINRMYYDSVLIDTAFQVISANPQYSYAMFKVDTGTHILENDSGFIGYVYGHLDAGSYGYALEGYTNCDMPVVNYTNQKYAPEVNIYPNPVQDKAIIKTENITYTTLQLTLYNVFGSPVYKKDYTKEEEKTIHRRQLPPGIYYYELKAEGKKIQTGKLIFN